MDSIKCRAGVKQVSLSGRSGFAAGSDTDAAPAPHRCCIRLAPKRVPRMSATWSIACLRKIRRESLPLPNGR